LSDIVKARGGIDVLFAELGDAANSGPALAFMATLIKDYGAVEQSVTLYYKALAMCPEMTTYVLNLVWARAYTFVYTHTHTQSVAV